MVSGGNEIKCYRIVHSVGREPLEVERPCTPREIKAAKAEKEAAAKQARAAQERLKLIEDRMGQYNRLMARCEKIFGPTACNR